MLRTQKVKSKEKVSQGSRRSRMGGVLGVGLFSKRWGWSLLLDEANGAFAERGRDGSQLMHFT